MGIADKLDELTQTFEKDRIFCEYLFNSRNAEQAAELFILHQWANWAFVICQNLLCNNAPNRFGNQRGEKAKIWTLVLSEGMHRDMRLVSYFAFRGLLSESATVLRRAFEHGGVLTHFWKEPSKLDAFEDPKQHATAFRCEVDKSIAKTLNSIGTAKRFSAMAMGQGATALYKIFSNFYVHGGTPDGIRSLHFDLDPHTCTFAYRSDPSHENVGKEIDLLRQGHQLLCCELVSLCLTHCVQTEEFTEASRILLSLVQTGENNTEAMGTAVTQLLSTLREERVSIQ